MIAENEIRTDNSDNVGIIALTGRHGTGKTTMINRFEETNPFPNIKVHLAKSQAKHVYNAYGARIQDALSYEKRLEIQEAILDSWAREIKECLKNVDPSKKNVILTDRSTIDIASYLLVNYTQGMSKELDNRTQDFLNKALAYAKKHIITTHIVFKYTFNIDERDFSNLFNTSYIAMHDKLLSGLRTEQPNDYSMPPKIGSEKVIRAAQSFCVDENDTDLCNFIFNKRYMELSLAVQNIFYPNLIRRMSDNNSSKS